MMKKTLITTLSISLVSIAGFATTAYAHCSTAGSSYIYIKNKSQDRLLLVGENANLGKTATPLKGFNTSNGVKYIASDQTGEMQACSNDSYPQGSKGLIDLIDGKALKNVPIHYNTKGSTDPTGTATIGQARCSHDYNSTKAKINYHCTYRGA